MVGRRSIHSRRRSDRVGGRWRSSTRAPRGGLGTLLLSFMVAPAPLRLVALFCGSLVSVHYTHHEVAAHYVVALKPDEGYTLDTGQRPAGVVQTAHPALWQVDLCPVAGYHHLRAEPEARQEHLHLLGGGVLGFVQDDERVVQGPTSHKRQRRDLDYTPLQVPLELGGVDHLVERVVERPEVGVDLRHHVARQEPERLPRLDRGPRQDDPRHLAPVQGLDGKRHREVGLPRPRGPYAKHDLVIPD